MDMLLMGIALCWDKIVGLFKAGKEKKNKKHAPVK